MIHSLKTSSSVVAGTLLLAYAAALAQPAPPGTAAQQCSSNALKVSTAPKLKLSKWGGMAGTPFGGVWRDNVESASPGHDWLVVRGEFACRTLPLEKTRVHVASAAFPLVAYSSECSDLSKADFTVLENSPGHGSIVGGGIMWAVMPSKDTGARTLYLTDNSPPRIGICLAFDVPKASRNLQLRIGEQAAIPVRAAK